MLQPDLDFARNRVERFLNASNFTHKLALIEIDGDATRAGDCRVRLYPSNRLRMLVTAFRTGNLDALRVKETHSVLHRGEPIAR